MRADPAAVDTEAVERLAHEGTEGVVTHLRDHRGPGAQPGGGHRDVRGAAAEVLGEAAHVLERNADLLRVEIDPHATHRDQVEALAHA
jgi:hypothetical protein